MMITNDEQKFPTPLPLNVINNDTVLKTGKVQGFKLDKLECES